MMRRILLSSVTTALLCCGAPDVRAEGGPIRTGEHAGFSRIVLMVAPDTEWQLQRRGNDAVVIFPRRSLEFRTDDVWRRMPRTRVTDIVADQTDEGATVRIELGCDCFVAAEVHGGRYLAVDVFDTRPVPVGQEEGDQKAGEPSRPPGGDHESGSSARAALAVAERLLIEQIERAADQGLVELTRPDALADLRLPVPAMPAEQTGRASTADREPAELGEGQPMPSPRAEASSPQAALDAAPADEGDQLLAHLGLRLPEHDQLRARTVFDRDATAPGPAVSTFHSDCRDDGDFDLARWSDGRPMADQAVDLRRRLVGEFDRPEPVAVRDLARLHVRYGFGTEALAILRSFGPGDAEHLLLGDLALLVDGRAAVGPLARDIACPGRHGLWLALAGSPSALTSDEHFPSIREAFEGLPLDMRALIGPDLVSRLVEAERTPEARIMSDVIVRTGIRLGRATELALGRLAAAEGDFSGAEARLGSIVATGGLHASDAALALVRTRLDAGGTVPEAWLLDLQALAIEQRGGAREAAARLLLAEGRARNGELATAMEIAAALAQDRADTRGAAQTMAARLLAEADPAAVGRSLYAELAMRHASMVPGTPEHDPFRLAIAEQLLGIGLGNAALDVIQPAAGRDMPEARVVAARAHLSLGEGGPAVELVAGLEGMEAAEVRARGLALTGDFEAAQTALETAPSESLLPYAWAAGDWALAAASSDPVQAAMASYMRDRDAPERPEFEVPQTPEEAFRQAPPRFEDPSLRISRSLVTSGAEVGAFVAALLAASGTAAPD